VVFKSKSSKRRQQTEDYTAQPWIVGRTNKRPNSGATPVKLRQPRRRVDKKTRKKVSSRIKLSLIVVLALLALNWIPHVKVSCRSQLNEPCQHLNDYKLLVTKTMDPFRHFVPFFNQSELEKVLNINTISQVSIEKGWFNIVSVNIVESSPFILWRNKVGPKDTYVIDKLGYIVDTVDSFSSEELNNLLTIRDESTLSPQPGDAPVDPQIVEYARQINYKTASSDYQLIYIDINDSPREFEAIFRGKIDSKKVITVRFTTVRGLEEQLVDYNMTLHYLLGEGKSFRYIDVRLKSATAYK